MKKTKQPGAWKRILPTLCFLLLGAVCGILFDILLFRFQPPTRMLPLLLLAFLAILYGAIALQIILHEAGHLVFGLLSGYRFCSFRVFGVMLLRKNGKLSLARYSLAGTGGQCLMIPPEWQDGIPTVLYHLGGSLMNLLAALVCALLLPALRTHAVVFLLLSILALVGLAFALINGIPMRTSQVDNDGANACSLRNHPDALRSFYLQMHIHAQIAQGQRLKQLPEAWFILPESADLHNSMVATIAVFRCNRCMDACDLPAAAAQIRALLHTDSGIIGLHRQLLQLELAYCEMLGENRQEELNRLLNREVNRLRRSMRKNPSVLRTELTLALRNNQKETAQKLLQRFERISRTYPYPAELQGERELIALAQKRFSAQ